MHTLRMYSKVSEEKARCPTELNMNTKSLIFPILLISYPERVKLDFDR